MKGDNMDFNIPSNLFVSPKEKSCLIIALTDDSILQLLEDKEVVVEDASNTIIIKYIGSIQYGIS